MKTVLNSYMKRIGIVIGVAGLVLLSMLNTVLVTYLVGLALLISILVLIRRAKTRSKQKNSRHL